MSKLKQYKMFIDGEWVDSESKKTFETLNPENNEPWAVVPEASTKDVDRAVKAAQKAFEGEWPKLLPRDRAKFLRAIGDQLRKNAEMLGKVETIDTGKLFRETKQQANYIAEYYDYYAGLADKVEGTVLPIDKPNVQAITTRIPIGVVAAIIPWNSQMFLTATKLAPALAMGNTVVIKSSELAPAVLFEFAKLIEKTGIPKGVVNVITGFGDPCGQHSPRPNPGALHNLRRINGAGGQHSFGAGRHLIPLAGFPIGHTSSGFAIDQNLFNKRPTDQLYIAAAQGRPKIGISRRPAAALPHRHISRAKPFLTIAIIIVNRRIAGFGCGGDKSIMQRIITRASGYMQWPGTAPPASRAAMRMFHTPKIWQYIGIAPAIRASLLPMIIITGITAHINHPIDRA